MPIGNCTTTQRILDAITLDVQTKPTTSQDQNLGHEILPGRQSVQTENQSAKARAAQSPSGNATPKTRESLLTQLMAFFDSVVNRQKAGSAQEAQDSVNSQNAGPAVQQSINSAISEDPELSGIFGYIKDFVAVVARRVCASLLATNDASEAPVLPEVIIKEVTQRTTQEFHKSFHLLGSVTSDPIGEINKALTRDSLSAEEQEPLKRVLNDQSLQQPLKHYFLTLSNDEKGKLIGEAAAEGNFDAALSKRAALLCNAVDLISNESQKYPETKLSKDEQQRLVVKLMRDPSCIAETEVQRTCIQKIAPVIIQRVSKEHGVELNPLEELKLIGVVMTDLSKTPEEHVKDYLATR